MRTQQHFLVSRKGPHFLVRRKVQLHSERMRTQQHFLVSRKVQLVVELLFLGQAAVEVCRIAVTTASQ